MEFERILFVATGVVMAVLADWCLTFWRNADNRSVLEDAEKILSAHGLSAHLYLPGIGVDDPVLYGALDRIAFSGRIVVDQKGNVVGKLMPKIEKGPHFRLVVDNSK